MRNFPQVQAFTRSILDGAGFGSASVEPGPNLPDIPNPYVLLTRYGGPGLTMNDTFDERAWQVRCVGDQNNPNQAEDLADEIDVAFLSHRSDYIDGVWVPEIRRVGGAPSPLMVDDADRTHYVCNYVIPVPIALAN